MKRFLILDDNLTICLMLKSWLTKKGYEVEIATRIDDAKEFIKTIPFDMLLLDIRMPEADGFTFLSWTKRYDSDVMVIMMTSFSDVETAVESMKMGAVDYISKPINPEVLFKKIDEAFGVQANRKLHEKPFKAFLRPPFPEYKSVFKRLDELAMQNSYIAIVGDHGTGKTSMVRHYLYEKCYDRSKPLIALDEDNLYSSVAAKDRHAYSKLNPELLQQKLVEARGGMLLVCNIEAMDKLMQDGLLTFMLNQKRDDSFVQIVFTSSKKDLQLKRMLIPKLYQQIERNIVTLPSLKDRKEFITFFSEHFLRFANSEFNRNITTLSPTFQKHLLEHPWPENIQELKNVIVKAALIANGSNITPDIVCELFDKKQRITSPYYADETIDISGLKKENYEKEKISEALELAKGNKTLAATILNIDRKTLYNKIKHYGMENLS